MTIGEALMRISGIGEGDIVSIDWIAADLAALTLRVVREERRGQAHQEAASPTQTRNAHAIEIPRQRNLHADMTPEQVNHHRLTTRSNSMKTNRNSVGQGKRVSGRVNIGGR